MVSEMGLSQCSALRQHTCKSLCPGRSDLIKVQIEVTQRYALRKYSSKALCPCCADLIVAEIEVSQCCALPQHCC